MVIQQTDVSTCPCWALCEGLSAPFKFLVEEACHLGGPGLQRQWTNCLMTGLVWMGSWYRADDLKSLMQHSGVERRRVLKQSMAEFEF